MTTTHPATDTHAVAITGTLRTFPPRTTDYTVTVIDRAGNAAATVVCGSKAAAHDLANTAWTALRAGSAPEKVWN